VPIALLHLSICPHTHIIVAPNGQTSVKFDIGDFHENQENPNLVKIGHLK